MNHDNMVIKRSKLIRQNDLRGFKSFHRNKIRNTPGIELVTKVWNPLVDPNRWWHPILHKFLLIVVYIYICFRNNIILRYLLWFISRGLIHIIPHMWIKLGQMTPPLPMQCLYSGCEYSTPTSIPMYEYLLKALELHVNSAHIMNISSQHNPTLKVE